MALMYAGSRAVASRPKECASRASKGHTSYKQGLADLMAIEDAMTSFNEGAQPSQPSTTEGDSDYSDYEGTDGDAPTRLAHDLPSRAIRGRPVVNLDSTLPRKYHKSETAAPVLQTKRPVGRPKGATRRPTRREKVPRRIRSPSLGPSTEVVDEINEIARLRASLEARREAAMNRIKTASFTDAAPKQEPIMKRGRGRPPKAGSSFKQVTRQHVSTHDDDSSSGESNIAVDNGRGGKSRRARNRAKINAIVSDLTDSTLSPSENASRIRFHEEKIEKNEDSIRSQKEDALRKHLEKASEILAQLEKMDDDAGNIPVKATKMETLKNLNDISGRSSPLAKGFAVGSSSPEPLAFCTPDQSPKQGGHSENPEMRYPASDLEESESEAEAEKIAEQNRPVIKPTLGKKDTVRSQNPNIKVASLQSKQHEQPEGEIEAAEAIGSDQDEEAGADILEPSLDIGRRVHKLNVDSGLKDDVGFSLETTVDIGADVEPIHNSPEENITLQNPKEKGRKKVQPKSSIAKTMPKHDIPQTTVAVSESEKKRESLPGVSSSKRKPVKKAPALTSSITKRKPAPRNARPKPSTTEDQEKDNIELPNDTIDSHSSSSPAEDDESDFVDVKPKNTKKRKTAATGKPKGDTKSDGASNVAKEPSARTRAREAKPTAGKGGAVKDDQKSKIKEKDVKPKTMGEKGIDREPPLDKKTKPTGIKSSIWDIDQDERKKMEGQISKSSAQKTQNKKDVDLKRKDVGGPAAEEPGRPVKRAKVEKTKATVKSVPNKIDRDINANKSGPTLASRGKATKNDISKRVTDKTTKPKGSIVLSSDSIARLSPVPKAAKGKSVFAEKNAKNKLKDQSIDAEDTIDDLYTHFKMHSYKPKKVATK